LGFTLVKYLILTSSGGGGHIAVADAEKSGLLQSGIPEEEIAVIDIMGLYNKANNHNRSWIPRWHIFGHDIFSGEANVQQWNEAQKKGGLKAVHTLEELIKLQWIAEAIQGSDIEKNLQEFIDSNPDLEQVIDTQALSTGNICRVVAKNNRNEAKPNLQYTKIMTEFFTQKAIHFLEPLSKVDKEDAKHLTVQVVNPLLIAKSDSKRAFFKRHGVGHIDFVERGTKPLRSAFLKENDNPSVYIQTHADDEITGRLKEVDFMRAALPQAKYIVKGSGRATCRYLKFDKQTTDTLITLTLGSQSSVAVLDYIDTFIKQVITSGIKPPERAMLCITTSKNDGSQNTMYAKARLHLDKRLRELEASGIEWPESASVIPLAFQDAKSMASLFKQSDVLIARAGGISSMEAEETYGVNPNRKVYIHTEAAPQNPTIFPSANFDAAYNSLLEGTVHWEGGNAQYLMKNIDASLASAETISFGLNKQPHASYQHSLLRLATNNQLKSKYYAEIKTCLGEGSSPNLEAIGGLPIMAYAKDERTLELLIQYGGKLTHKVTKHLLEKEVITQERLQSLKKIESIQQAEMQRIGYTPRARAQFLEAIHTGDTAAVQGLLNRLPKLAFIQQAHFVYPADREKQQMIRNSIRHIRGIPMLSLQLEQQENPMQFGALKYEIYLNQASLNQEDLNRKTPLSYCKSTELRKLMVVLGANPDYLHQDTPDAEKTTLKTLSALSHKKTRHLQKMILSAYIAHADNRQEFSTAVNTGLAHEFNNFQASEDITNFAFNALHSAKSEVELMGALQRIINFIKWIFSADILSQSSRLESRKLLFYKEHASTEAPATEPPDLDPLAPEPPPQAVS
jgi:hypothetical protein